VKDQEKIIYTVRDVKHLQLKVESRSRYSLCWIAPQRRIGS